MSARASRPRLNSFPRNGQNSGQQSAGGADRDRTGDPLLAKQVLSQLSYGPMSLVNQRRLVGQDWWAREDLNFRPHAYQARALTS
jgi:hypothetical protein